MSKYLTKYLIITALIAIGVFSSTSKVIAQSANQTDSSVSFVLIYQHSCGTSCDELLTQFIPSLQAKYGAQLEIIAIDSELPTNETLINHLFSYYRISGDLINTPLMISDTNTLTGIEQIKSNADDIISTELQNSDNVPPLARVSISETMLRQELASTRSELGNTQSSLQNTAKELENAKTELDSIQRELNNMRIGIFLPTTLVGILFIVAVALGIALRHVSIRSKSLQLKLTHASKKSTEMEEKFIGTLIGKSTSGVDFLAEMVKVEFEYKRRRTVSENAAFLARDFLLMVERYMAITPLAEYGTQVRYNPAIHQSREIHKPGDKVWVLEPGWKRQDIILKRALVRAQ